MSPRDSELHRLAAFGASDAALDAAIVYSGIDINAPGSNGATALHAAAASGSPAAVTFLLSKNADPARRDASGATPLHRAAERSALACALALVEAGAPLVAADNAGATPLHVAAEVGSEQLAKLLLEHSADPERMCTAKDAEGRTAGEIARALGRKGIIRAIVDAQRGGSYAGINPLFGLLPRSPSKMAPPPPWSSEQSEYLSGSFARPATASYNGKHLLGSSSSGVHGSTSGRVGRRPSKDKESASGAGSEAAASPLRFSRRRQSKAVGSSSSGCPQRAEGYGEVFARLRSAQEAHEARMMAAGTRATYMSPPHLAVFATAGAEARVDLNSFISLRAAPFQSRPSTAPATSCRGVEAATASVKLRYRQWQQASVPPPLPRPPPGSFAALNAPPPSMTPPQHLRMSLRRLQASVRGTSRSLSPTGERLGGGVAGSGPRGVLRASLGGGPAPCKAVEPLGSAAEAQAAVAAAVAVPVVACLDFGDVG